MKNYANYVLDVVNGKVDPVQLPETAKEVDIWNNVVDGLGRYELYFIPGYGTNYMVTDHMCELADAGDYEGMLEYYRGYTSVIAPEISANAELYLTKASMIGYTMFPKETRVMDILRLSVAVYKDAMGNTNN